MNARQRRKFNRAMPTVGDQVSYVDTLGDRQYAQIVPTFSGSFYVRRLEHECDAPFQRTFMDVRKLRREA